MTWIKWAGLAGVWLILAGCTGYWGRRGKPIPQATGDTAVEGQVELPPADGVIRAIRKGPSGAPPAQREDANR